MEEEVLETLNWASLDKTKLDEHISVLVASRTGRQFFTREKIESLLETARKNGENYEVSDFKVLNKDESVKSRFATIAYEITLKKSVGKATTSTHIISHEIWERQLAGWHRLSAATDQ